MIKRILVSTAAIGLAAGLLGAPSANAASITCSFYSAPNGTSAYCTGDRGYEYRNYVRCYQDGVANRIVTAYGPWRNVGGANMSTAVCNPGDSFTGNGSVQTQPR